MLNERGLDMGLYVIQGYEHGFVSFPCFFMNIMSGLRYMISPHKSQIPGDAVIFILLVFVLIIALLMPDHEDVDSKMPDVVAADVSNKSGQITRDHAMDKHNGIKNNNRTRMKHIDSSY